MSTEQQIYPEIIEDEETGLFRLVYRDWAKSYLTKEDAENHIVELLLEYAERLPNGQ